MLNNSFLAINEEEDVIERVRQHIGQGEPNPLPEFLPPGIGLHRWSQTFNFIYPLFLNKKRDEQVSFFVSLVLCFLVIKI